MKPRGKKWIRPIINWGEQGWKGSPKRGVYISSMNDAYVTESIYLAWMSTHRNWRVAEAEITCCNDVTRWLVDPSTVTIPNKWSPKKDKMFLCCCQTVLMFHCELMLPFACESLLPLSGKKQQNSFKSWSFVGKKNLKNLNQLPLLMK